MNIKKLDTDRKYQSYKLKQIIRSETKAIYSVLGTNHYEVVKIRAKKLGISGYGQEKLNDLGFTHVEVYPPSEKWGIDGFTYLKLEDAQAKYNSM